MFGGEQALWNRLTQAKQSSTLCHSGAAQGVELETEAHRGGPQPVSVGRNQVCKPESRSIAENMEYFENIQLIIIDIHTLENALKDLIFWFLLKTLEEVVSDGLIFQPDRKQLESCNH